MHDFDFNPHQNDLIDIQSNNIQIEYLHSKNIKSRDSKLSDITLANHRTISANSKHNKPKEAMKYDLE